MTEKEILELTKWYVVQPKQIQLAVWQEFESDKQAEQKRKEFAKAIKNIKAKMFRDKRKFLNREVGLEELRETTKLRIAALRKPRTQKKSRRGNLKKRVKYRIKLINQLRAEGLGWRLIARYLGKYAGLQISHVHLRRLYLQFQEEQNKTDNQIIRTQNPKIVIRKKSN